MRNYIRTSQRIAPGVSFVSYQKPGEYLFGIFIALVIGYAILGSLFKWIVIAFVVINWLNAILNRGIVAKALWSMGLLFASAYIWIDRGCPGNADYCAKIAAEDAANERQAAKERAEERMASCAENSNWRSDAECSIYTVQEITNAKAKHDAKSAADGAKRNAEAMSREAVRREQIIMDRDTSRDATAQQR